MKPDSIGTFASQPPVIGTFASANRALLLQPTIAKLSDVPGKIGNE